MDRPSGAPGSRLPAARRPGVGRPKGSILGGVGHCCCGLARPSGADSQSLARSSHCLSAGTEQTVDEPGRVEGRTCSPVGGGPGPAAERGPERRRLAGSSLRFPPRRKPLRWAPSDGAGARYPRPLMGRAARRDSCPAPLSRSSPTTGAGTSPSCSTSTATGQPAGSILGSAVIVRISFRSAFAGLLKDHAGDRLLPPHDTQAGEVVVHHVHGLNRPAGLDPDGVPLRILTACAHPARLRGAAAWPPPRPSAVRPAPSVPPGTARAVSTQDVD